jgi:hypothetical protein
VLKGKFPELGAVVENVANVIKTGLSTAVDVAKGVFQAFGNTVKLVLWPIQTIIKVITGLFTGGLSGAVEAFQGQIGKLGEIFTGIFEGIKTAIGSLVNFWKNVFQGAVDAVKGIIDGFTENFGGVFDSIKEKTEGFINFFKEKMAVVKDFFGGIGDKIGGLFGNGKTIDIAAHATGGIFTQPHIAQIAEQGAEAVVPLNNSPGGFDTWKQAGELGGYVKTASEQSPAISVAASVSAATPPVKTFEPSPVMAAAAQRISAGDTTVRLEFKMTNNFNGGTPDGETVNQIFAAGQKVGEDLESKIRSIFDSMTRDRMRVSYG